MPKPEWGVKRSCASCGARFYDLNANPITCPECGAVWATETGARARRSRAVVEPEVETEDDDAVVDDAAVLDETDQEEAVEVPVAEGDAEEDDADTLGDGGDAVLLEDGDDEDDLGEFGGEASGDDEDSRR